MTNFYATVEQEIGEFVQRCHDLLNAVDPSSVSSSIPCLTAVSVETCSRATEQLNLFLDLLTSYIADTSIESDIILSIVADSFDVVQSLSLHQHLFIEYAIEDYLFLDEHCHSVYEKVLVLLDHCHRFPDINSELYHLEQTLLSHLPSTYSRTPAVSLPDRIASTLIEQTSRLLSSSGNALTNHDVDDDHGGVLPSIFFFSSTPVSISLNDENTLGIVHDRSDQGQSLLQLDKIDIHTTALSRSEVYPLFPLDLTDLEQIVDDLKDQNQWVQIEQAFLMNLVSSWSNEELPRQTLDPWSSETLWKIIIHFKQIDMNLKSAFVVIIQWSFCLLAIEAFNRDWDLLYSKTLINTITSNRWRTVRSSDQTYLSNVGHSLNQMFLRLIQIVSVLNYMKMISTQSADCHTFFSHLILSTIQSLTQRILSTSQLLILWFDQQADAFINSNILERTLVICQSDRKQLSSTVTKLVAALEELKTAQSTITSVKEMHSACQSISNEKMSKLYRRIHMNTHIYFSDYLPLASNDWRTNNPNNSLMVVACDKLLKPALYQLDCSKADVKVETYERIVSSFTEAWTTTLRERKYRFSEDLINYFQNDYEYLKTFLATVISNQNIVQALIQSSPIQQISEIIYLLRTGDKSSSPSSTAPLPNRDKWLRSRKPSSPLLEFIQNACCCQRRNRVTTES